MARKTYPETPAEEAARINAASGNPEGITAAQVSNNRALNEKLTASFGFGATKHHLRDRAVILWLLFHNW